MFGGLIKLLKKKCQWSCSDSSNAHLPSQAIQYLYQPLVIYYIQAKNGKKLNIHSGNHFIHPISMPQDEVDPSFITNVPWKWTLSSYVHNIDNISGD